MVDPRFTLMSAAIAAPLIASLLLRQRNRARWAATAVTGISLLAVMAALLFGESTSDWVMLDHLAAGPTVMFGCVVLAMLVTAPDRDVRGWACSDMLIALSGTLLVYTAFHPALLVAGWAISAIPMMRISASGASSFRRPHIRPAVMLLLSICLLSAAVLLLSLPQSPAASALGFTFAVLAALIRSGIFPFHSWMLASFQEDSIFYSSALFSAQCGAFLIARLAATPALADPARVALPVLSSLALFSAVLMAFLAFGEREPRRILTLVIASQSGFIIGGLEMWNVEGIAGALIHWLVVSIAATGLASVLRSLEARCPDLLSQRFAGLSARTPRLSILFLLFALALVGLPGTLGFAAEDLLFHGAIDAHPVLGVALPLAAALNAIHLLRLFANVFLGRRAIHVPAVADALPRERWALTALALFLIAAGFLPHYVVDAYAHPAKSIASFAAAASARHR